MAGAINSWDAAKPAGTDYIDASDELIRANWAAIEVMTGAMFQNLELKNGATAATQVDIDADRIALFDTSSPPLCYVARSVNLTADIAAAVGPNGPENATLEAASKWIFVWVIYNPATDTLASVLSAASAWANVVKTDISGYAFARLVGAVYNDAASNFVAFIQRGNRVTYKAAQFAIQNLGSAPSWENKSLTAFVPSIAKRIFGWADMTNTGTGGPHWQLLALAADNSGNYPTSKMGGYIAMVGSGRYTHFPYEQEITSQNVAVQTAASGGTISINFYLTGYYIEI